jgi:hypothetical protein
LGKELAFLPLLERLAKWVVNFQEGIRQAPVRRRKFLKRGGFTLLSFVKGSAIKKERGKRKKSSTGENL